MSGDTLDRDELLVLDCDVLIPAAIGEVIHKKNWKKIQAKHIIEAANLPVTCEADGDLFGKGVVIVLDILANAGGVAASYLEWSQNHQRYRWSRKRVLEELEDLMRQSWKTTRELVEKEDISHREAACRVAVERVLHAMKLRGF